MLSLDRRAYNLTVERIQKKEAGDKTLTRREVREQVRGEWERSGRVFCSVVSDEAVNRAYDTWKACARKWKIGQIANLRFRSCKESRQSFTVQKLSTGVFPKLLTTKHLAEPVPAEAKGGMATVTFENGRWFLCCKKSITIRKREIQACPKVVALDPGIRTFLTFLSPGDAGKYGQDFSVKKILPLLHEKQRLTSRRDLLHNKKCEAQWWKDQVIVARKKLDKVTCRIADLVADLHRRVAYDLVSNYDVILLPRFESKRMSAKGGRKLRKRTIREMLQLGFYKFEQVLRWMCVKYGKTLVSTTEEYTSKTRSWDGVIHPTLGSAKTIGDGSISVDRDINGARGIFLLTSTRQLTPLSDLKRYT